MGYAGKDTGLIVITGIHLTFKLDVLELKNNSIFAR